MATIRGFCDADQLPADDEGEVCVFLFDEEMTLASRMTKNFSAKTIERRQRLEQKLVTKRSK